MTSLATPFISSSRDNCLATLIKRRTFLCLCLLLFAQGALRAQDVAQATATTEARNASSGTGTITGRVMSDDGRPLSDTVVFLNRAFARVPGTPLTATTDSEGRFRISGLEPGLYAANAMLPGYTTQDALNDSGEMNYYRIGDSIDLMLVKGGVITGTVRDANGEPVIAVPVRALRIRDATGRTPMARFSGFSPERMTDDRGVYRLYGLPPGTYLVSAGGSQRMMLANAYEGDSPTFFPSSTRDTAAEVPVRGGEEATSIDIRYRAERGHTISGTVSGMIETKAPSGVSITLRQVPGGGYEGATFIMPGVKTGFSFNGVSDGVYEVAAQQWGGVNDSAASLPRRITIKGADVTGIELVLSTLASITGRVQLDAPPKESCAEGRGGTLIETAIHARRDVRGEAENSSSLPFFSASGSVPTDQGEFTIRNLMAGNYRLGVRLPSESWYIRAIVLPNTPATPATAPAKSAQPAKSTPPASNLIAVKTGAHLTNVNVQIAQDAAALRGRVASAAEAAEGAQQLPPNLKVYLIPTERERAEDVLRYGEAQLGSDGTFALLNLAPGRYWIIARPAPESESPERTPRPLAWDADTRARLRREAEAANTTIELKSCQRVGDYLLRYGAAAAK
jgi:Carboxypeptidase regulatory-like domain